MMVIDLRGFFFFFFPSWLDDSICRDRASKFFFALRLPGRGTRERGKEGKVGAKLIV